MRPPRAAVRHGFQMPKRLSKVMSRAVSLPALLGPGFVQALEVEQALDETLFEDGERFDRLGHGDRS